MRAPVFVSVIISAVALATADAQTVVRTSSAAAPWAMMRGGPDGTGTAPGGVRPPFRNLTRLTTEHTFTGAVAADRRVFFGSSDHNLYAYQITTSAMISIGGALIPIDENLQPVAPLALAWKFATGADIEAPPAVAGDTVLVASTDHYLYALSAKEGNLRWKLKLGDDAGAPPIVADKVVYVGADDGIFRAVEIERGKVLWATDLGGAIRSAAAVIGNRVFVASTNHFAYALERSTGKVLWETDTEDDIAAPLAATGERVFVVNSMGRLLSLEAATGKVAWEYGKAVMGNSGVAVTDKRVIAQRRDNAVVALDAQSGQPIWIGEELAAGAPVVGGATVYVPQGEGQVAALGEASGRRLDDSDLLTVGTAPGTRARRGATRGATRAESRPTANDEVRLGEPLGPSLHLALYDRFVFATAPRTLDMIVRRPPSGGGLNAGAGLEFPTISGSAGIPVKHPVAVAEIYLGTEIPLWARRILNPLMPNQYVRATNRTFITLDATRSHDPLGHRLVSFLWSEPLGDAPIVQRYFGLGSHEVYLIVVDEENLSCLYPAGLFFTIELPGARSNTNPANRFRTQRFGF